MAAICHSNRLCYNKIMRFLRIMLVIALLLANYAAAAQAFGGVPHCPKSMTAGGKVMDCCKEKSGQPMKCPCASCDGCITLSPAALLTGFTLDSVPVNAAPESLPAPVLPQLIPPPDFRPPDSLA